MTSPPAADPPTTIASTPIPAIPFAPTVRPSSNSMVPNPIPHQKQQIPYPGSVRHPNTTPLQLPKSPQGVLYPVASSGRGYIPKSGRPPDHSSVTIAARSVLPFSQQQQQQHLMGSIKGLPVPTPAKVATSPSPSAKPAGNGYKDSRDRSNDDSVIVVRDRKVRLSAGDSLYGLGRSWLRNGFPEEHLSWQPHFGDFSKTLPKPSPVTDSHASEDKPEENEDKEENVEDLSAKDLLKGHIQRAKRVRLRAKEERMKRISRFRTRIALLLPQEAEQFRSDAAAATGT